jgi:hypothetical protein
MKSRILLLECLTFFSIPFFLNVQADPALVHTSSMRGGRAFDLSRKGMKWNFLNGPWVIRSHRSKSD